MLRTGNIEARQVSPVLLILAQGPAGGEELELRSIQTDSLGLHRQDIVNVRREADICHDGEASNRILRLSDTHGFAFKVVETVERLFPGPESHQTGIAIYQQFGPVRDLIADTSKAANGRNAHCPRQDRGVRGPPAAFGNQGDDPLGVNVHRHARGKLLGNDNLPLREGSRFPVLRHQGGRRFGPKLIQNATTHFRNIRAAFPNIHIIQLADPRLVEVQYVHERRFRGETLSLDLLCHLPDQHRVTQYGLLDFEYEGFGLANPLADIGDNAIQLFDGPLDGEEKTYVLRGLPLQGNA